MTDPNREQRLAEAHDASVAFPPRSEVSRYDQLSPEARTLLREFDELDLAEILVAAQADVQRVIALYERWVKAGPPPLGTSMSRWWDTRLAELHTALNPPKEQ